MAGDKTRDGEVLYEVEPEKFLARITLNRPEKRNAIRNVDEVKIEHFIYEAEKNDDVKIILFSGMGNNFTSGHDLNDAYNNYGSTGQPGERRPSQRARLLSLEHEVWGRRSFMQAIAYCKKVTVAKVEGYCYGHGVPMILHSDFAIASMDARFSHPAFLYHGFGGDFTAYIQNVGMKKTKEMCFDCRPVSAEDAARIGLVTYAVPKDQLEETVQDLIKRIGRMPKDAIVMAKAHLECAMHAVGMGAGLAMSSAVLAWASNVRYEHGEFNLISERHKTGLTQALKQRDQTIDRSFVDKK